MNATGAVQDCNFTLYIKVDQKVCVPDDYNTIVRCTETFWSPCMLKTNTGDCKAVQVLHTSSSRPRVLISTALKLPKY